MLYDERQGRIDVLSVTTTEDPSTPLEYEVLQDDQILWIDLEEAVQPGEFTEFQIMFNTTLPDGLDRGNVHGEDSEQSRIFTMSSSYPIPCVYDKWEEWNTDPYVEYSDPYYFDMAYYEFRLTVPDEMVVASTGELMDSQSDGEFTTYHFNPGLPVRELTFSASRYFRKESMKVNGVNVSTVYIHDSAPEWGSDALNMAKQSLELFNETFGVYPYPTLNVVEQWGFYGGMEYPCQIYVTRGVIEHIRDGSYWPRYFELVIAHEIGHEWWSQLVGDDCIDWGFVDEMLTCWSHNHYAENYYGDWEYFQYTRYVDTVRNFYHEWEIGTPVNMSHADRPDLVGYIDYTKGPLVMEKLRLTLGHDTFVACLRYFFEEFKYKIAILPDLQDAFENVVGENLDWLFLPLFDNPYLPDYSFQSVIYDVNDGTLSITVQDVNEDSNPYSYSQKIPLLVYNSTNQEMIDEEVWINGTTTLTFSVSSRPSRVRLVYGDYVLVQLEEYGNSYLETSSIEIITLPNDPLIIFVGVLSVVVVCSLVVLFVVMRRKKVY
jgi:aminopeptidase N